MDLIVTFLPLNYSIQIHLDAAQFRLPIDSLKNLIRHALSIPADYPLDLRDIDNTILEGTIDSLQNNNLITIRDPLIIEPLYQHARMQNDIPNVVFPPPGQEILAENIRHKIVANIRRIQERREPIIHQPWFPWLFPAPERLPDALRDDPNNQGIRRAIDLLNNSNSSVCQRVMSWFRTPLNTFLCGICDQEDTTINGGQVWLSCRHSFHLYCIGRNMTRHIECPYCHAEIVSMTRCRPSNAFMGRKTRYKKNPRRPKRSRLFHKRSSKKHSRLFHKKK